MRSCDGVETVEQIIAPDGVVGGTLVVSESLGGNDSGVICVGFGDQMNVSVLRLCPVGDVFA